MTRFRTGAALLIVAVALLAWLAAGVIGVIGNPRPQTIEAEENGATILFAADRTQFVFPGDCSTARWQVGGIRAVHFYTYPVTGEEQRIVCHGDAPYLRVRFQDGTEQTHTLSRDVLFLRPAVIVATLAMLVTGALAAYLLGVKRWLQTPRGQMAAAFTLAVAWVVILDLFTNSAYIVIGPTFDAARTLEISRNGWLGNPNMLAPWAYRPVTPLLARAISDLLGQSLDTGFTVIAYAGAVAQLTLVYALARYFGGNFRASLAAMLVVGFSTYNLRYLLYDIYRPDQLAFALIVIVLLALWRGRVALSLLAACFGILTREWVAIPAMIVILRLLVDGIRQRSARKLIWLVVAVVAIGAAIALPRLLIPVADSAQRFDPLNRPDAFLTELVFPWYNTARNYEYLAVAASYFLPVLLLVTPARLARAWKELVGYRWMLGVYVALTFLVTLYGGGDLQRFIAYFFVVQVIAQAIWLRDAGWLEIALILAAVAVSNRLFWMPGVDPMADVLRIGSIVEPALTAARLQEIAFFVTAAAIGRMVVSQLPTANRQKPSLAES